MRELLLRGSLSMIRLARDGGARRVRLVCGFLLRDQVRDWVQLMILGAAVAASKSEPLSAYLARCA